MSSSIIILWKRYAAGPWVHSSRTAMVRVLANIRAGATSGLLNALSRFGIIAVARLILFRTLGLSWKMLLRVTHFLSRHREFRSDELACHIGGTAAFVQALHVTHTIPPTFAPFWNTAIEPLLAAGYRPPLAVGFAIFLSAPSVKASAAKILDHQMNETRTNPLHTHPPLAEHVRRPSTVPNLEEDQRSEIATTLLDDLDSVEQQLIAFLAPLKTVTGLKKTDWDTAGLTVYLPAWEAAVPQFADLLRPSSIGQLPELIQSFREIAPRIPDPPGRLLTREQRDERAYAILWMAMGAALIRVVWTLHAAWSDLDRSGEPAA